MKHGLRLGGLARIVGMVIITLIVLAPLYWVVSSGFKPRSEIISASITWFPRSWTLSNFTRLFDSTEYVQYLTNSVIVAFGTTLVSTLFSVSAAYGLYRLRIRGNGTIAGIILLSYLVPGTLLIVPLYRTLAGLNLIDSYPGLILVNVAFTAPFCTWMLRGFILNIPREVDEAAALDGAGAVRVMTRIVLPLMKPGIATVALFSFVYSWTEYVFTSQFVLSDSMKTLPLGLSDIVGRYSIDWGLVMAGTTLTMAPTLVVFALLGRLFVAGLISGTSK